MAGEVTTEDNNMDPGADVTGFENAGNEPGNFFQDILTDPQKRLYAIIAAVALVLILTFGFMSFQKNDENRGKLVPLVQEIDQSRAFEIVAKLKSVNIEAKVDPGERPGEYVVHVYEKAIESSYLTLSRTNLLEDDDYGLFDENDWAASDYDKRIKLTRAINGDLSRIISRMDGLRSAIVRVNVPEQQIFTELQAATTATVQVELENDAEELTKSQVKSIVNLLRGYVPNLDKEKVSIVDTQGRNYSTFKEEDETDGGDFIEEMERLNKTIKERIAKYLDVVVGKDLYEVSVSASLSREKVEKQETIYKDGAVGSRQTGTENLNTKNSAAAGPGSGSGKNYNSKSTNETMLPSFEQKNVTYLPGRITAVTVALAIDKSVPAMISLEQLRESVAAIIGPQTSAEHVKLTVVDMQAKGSDVEPLVQESGGIMTTVNNFFQGGFWSGLTKIFTIIAIVIGLLLVSIISLNFLSAAANRNYETEVDENLGDEFDDVLNESGVANEDYGESKSIAQQEALLKEMMSQSGDMEEGSQAEERPVTSYDVPSEDNEEKVQFESLLNNFQTVASSKPDLLAKKIQLWLDDDS